MLCEPDDDERPILVTASVAEDARLAEECLEELLVSSIHVADGREALRPLCRTPGRFAGAIGGHEAGPVSGWTVCGSARDAGCRLPLILLENDGHRLAAERAARLRVTLLWRPVTPRRLTRAVLAVLPRRLCAS